MAPVQTYRSEISSASSHLFTPIDVNAIHGLRARDIFANHFTGVSLFFFAFFSYHQSGGFNHLLTFPSGSSLSPVPQISALCLQLWQSYSEATANPLLPQLQCSPASLVGLPSSYKREIRFIYRLSPTHHPPPASGLQGPTGGGQGEWGWGGGWICDRIKLRGRPSREAATSSFFHFYRHLSAAR